MAAISDTRGPWRAALWVTAATLLMAAYLGRRVLPIQTLGDLDRVMAEHPRGSAVLSHAALGEVADRRHLRVLPLDWLNFDPIVLVSYPDAPAPRAGSRP